MHIDHGIGKFGGLEKIEVNGKIQEAIKLVYRIMIFFMLEFILYTGSQNIKGRTIQNQKYTSLDPEPGRNLSRQQSRGLRT